MHKPKTSSAYQPRPDPKKKDKKQNKRKPIHKHTKTDKK